VKLSRLIIFILPPLLLASCATLDESECLTADWRTIGLEDGAQGRPLSYISNHRKACAEHGVTPDLAAYQGGHEVGVRQYCTPQNGFQQGRAGRAYGGVCPDQLAPGFRAAYDTGLKLHNLDAYIGILRREGDDLRKDREDATEQHQAIETVLLNGGMSARDRKRMLERYSQLQQEITELDIDIRETEQEAAMMQGEYNVLDAAHGY